MLKKIPSDELLMQGAAPPSAIDPSDYWRLCDRLSVEEAALLIIGADPSAYTHLESQMPRGHDAARAALARAIQAKKLPADMCEEDEDSRVISWHGTTGSGRRFAKLVEIARLQDRFLFSRAATNGT